MATQAACRSGRAAYTRREMRRVAATLVSGVLVCVFAAAVSARSGAIVPLPLHGTISLSGSKILCGSGHLNGLTYIDCGVADASGQPKRGGYVALMAANGRVSIAAVSTNKIVFSRTPAAAIRATVGTPVHTGDLIELPATSILCNVSLISGKPTIVCEYVDRKGVVRPNSYSFGIGDTLVTSLGWDSTRHVHLLKSWPENG